jgi:hypothetical protein
MRTAPREERSVNAKLHHIAASPERPIAELFRGAEAMVVATD